jgi:hypothetical protein
MKDISMEKYHFLAENELTLQDLFNQYLPRREETFTQWYDKLWAVITQELQVRGEALSSVRLLEHFEALYFY